MVQMIQTIALTDGSNIKPDGGMLKQEKTSKLSLSLSFSKLRKLSFRKPLAKLLLRKSPPELRKLPFPEPPSKFRWIRIRITH